MSTTLRFRRLARYLRPYAGWILLAAALGLLAAGANALDPLFYRYLLDLVVRAAEGQARTRPPVAAAVAAVGGLLLVNAVAQALDAGLTLAANKTRFDASFDLSRGVLRRVLHLPLGDHVSSGEEFGAGALMTRMDRGVGALGQLIGDLLQSVLPNLANLFVIAALMFRLSPRLSWVALAPLPFFLWATARATRAGVSAEEEIQTGWRRLYRRVHEVLGAIKMIQAMGGEGAELRRYEGGAARIFARLWALMRLDTGYGAVRGGLAALGRAGVLLYGAVLVLHARISPGTWMAAVAYAGMIYSPLTGLTGIYTSLSKNLVTAGAALDLPTTREDAEAAEPAPAAADWTAEAAATEDAGEDAEAEAGEIARGNAGHSAGEIVFDRVAFSYPGSEGAPPAPALRDVSFRIAPGEVVALVGPSGGGKTTIADLLLRFYRPTRGRIYVDGRNLNELAVDNWRQRVSVVLQEAMLLEGTVAENIALSAPSATRDQVRAAARAAQAEEFILRLPGGFDARIGERGARLSGGQRQRIAVARALLRPSRLVILDEVSSNLDGESEAALNESLAALLAGRSVLMITHRPASLALADRVLVISAGEVIESGRPGPLLRAGGPCAALFAPAPVPAGVMQAPGAPLLEPAT